MIIIFVPPKLICIFRIISIYNKKGGCASDSLRSLLSVLPSQASLGQKGYGSLRRLQAA
jgi:hypothetical protein